MLIENLDRSQWRLAQAVEHISGLVLSASAGARELETATTGSASFPIWANPADPAVAVRQQAEREIQIAMRDGDLHAQGRLSTTPCQRWSGLDDGWELHSGHHSHITPEQWRGGRADVAAGRLTMLDGQFIDIRVPRFMVLAIWPATEASIPSPAPDPMTGEPYRTPYMELLDRAIAANRLSYRNQDKKETLTMWFREQTVEGEPLSQNLADAMATLVRMPSSQRGGAKRGW
jgi:hypothetical protein